MYLFVCGVLIRIRLGAKSHRIHSTGVAAAPQLGLEYTGEWKCPGPLNTLSIVDLEEAEISGDCSRQRGKHK